MRQPSSLHSWVAPAAMLTLMILAYGLMIPWLGFYWDDWPIVLASRLQGVDAFWEYYRYERPFSAWTYIATIPILGTTPLPWHIFTLLLRWVSVVEMWWCLNLLWPQRRSENTWMAMLFAIYPIFTNQPVALTFNQQWVVFWLYFLALGLMLLSIQKPRWSLALNGVGVAATLVHMLTMEYAWGLELLRPLVLWLAYSQLHPDLRRHLLATLKHWAPYALAFCGVIAWRLLSSETLYQSNEPGLLYSLTTAPLDTILRLAQLGLQDMVNNLLGAWYLTVNPSSLVLTDRVVLASLGLAALTASLAYLYLRRADTGSENTDAKPTERGWLRQALFLGLAGALAGPLPVWLIEKNTLTGLHSGRFALAAMVGLSLLIVGLLEWFTPRRTPKIVLLSILFGLAAGFHLRNAVTYYRSTLQQNQFYWQLYWRAPYLEPGTALLSADELFPYVGRNPTAVTLNLLYPQPEGQTQVDYWFLELYHDVGSKNVPRLARGRQLTASFRTFSFRGSSLDSLVIFYKPGAGRCLWVLSPQDADNPELPEITLQALPVSNLGQIAPGPVTPGYPPTDLFGQEPAHNWCYFYQKAELARQLGDWQAIAELSRQAEAGNHSPNNQNEWLPFIEGLARNGEWEAALQKTQSVYAADTDLAPRLCNLWQRITDNGQPPPSAQADVDTTLAQLGCHLAP